jgi:hypothetical protein
MISNRFLPIRRKSRLPLSRDHPVILTAGIMLTHKMVPLQPRSAIMRRTE